ncbi:uncharacterized protein LOC113330992 isoform X1 [Papaver somniferum]|uniref:uncharacterized protein LOC113330992 isoform X1 n=1 Tax=Papaver somniferum TaxID=3469 RepID=UPI000E6FA965|nr:uncharacterized protein LOC113330992 isoform X1 [Papaver somniferum]
MIPRMLCWNNFPNQIGNEIGKTVKVDGTTENISRRRFVRICIEVDLLKPLLPAVRIGKLIQPIEYEGVSSICFHCGRANHRIDNCPQKQPATSDVAAVQADKPTTNAANLLPTEFGAWMLVDLKSRRNPTNPARKNPPTSGSRFHVLRDSGNCENVENRPGIKNSSQHVGKHSTTKVANFSLWRLGWSET